MARHVSGCYRYEILKSDNDALLSKNAFDMPFDAFKPSISHSYMLALLEIQGLRVEPHGIVANNREGIHKALHLDIRNTHDLLRGWVYTGRQVLAQTIHLIQRSVNQSIHFGTCATNKAQIGDGRDWLLRRFALAKAHGKETLTPVFLQIPMKSGCLAKNAPNNIP